MVCMPVYVLKNEFKTSVLKNTQIGKLVSSEGSFICFINACQNSFYKISRKGFLGTVVYLCVSASEVAFSLAAWISFQSRSRA